MSMGHWWNDTDREKTKVQPLPASLCPTQIAHWFTWDWKRASSATSRGLSAWAIERPLMRKINPHYIHGFTSYRAVHTLCIGYKNQPGISVQKSIAVCSENHAKQTNTLFLQKVILYSNSMVHKITIRHWRVHFYLYNTFSAYIYTFCAKYKIVSTWMIPGTSHSLNTDYDQLEATFRKWKIYFQITNTLFCWTSKLTIGVLTLMKQHLP